MEVRFTDMIRRERDLEDRWVQTKACEEPRQVRNRHTRRTEVKWGALLR